MPVSVEKTAVRSVQAGPVLVIVGVAALFTVTLLTVGLKGEHPFASAYVIEIVCVPDEVHATLTALVPWPVIDPPPLAVHTYPVLPGSVVKAVATVGQVEEGPVIVGEGLPFT